MPAGSRPAENERSMPAFETSSLSGRIIVCVASAWDYDPTSKHHLMKLLARDNQILWVNYHGTRRPQLNAADVRSACSVLKRFVGGSRPIARNMVQLTPLVLPGASNPLIATVSRAMLIRQIRQALRVLNPRGEKPVQVWSFAPDVGELVGAFEEECFVYYCVDEFSEFEGMDRARIQAGEDTLLKKADVVITTSASLHASRIARRPDTVLIRHGVDYTHFARSWRESLPMPSDLNRVPRPIFGFFGLIQHWMDLELIARVARLRPQYSFFLIGEVQSDTSSLRDLPNVHLPGRRPFADLPAYCAYFAGGLLLFKRTAMTRNVNPIKLFEYLAAGLPVVSTTIPEVARVAGPIQLADSPEQYAAACDLVLANQPRHSRQQTSALVADQTWESRLAFLGEVIGRNLAERNRGAASCVQKSVHTTTSPVNESKTPACTAPRHPTLSRPHPQATIGACQP